MNNLIKTLSALAAMVLLAPIFATAAALLYSFSRRSTQPI